MENLSLSFFPLSLSLSASLSLCTILPFSKLRISLCVCVYVCVYVFGYLYKKFILLKNLLKFFTIMLVSTNFLKFPYYAYTHTYTQGGHLPRWSLMISTS